MPNWAIVLTVGTTPDPLKEAIEKLKDEAEQQGANLRVWLLYGRSLTQQSPNPFEVAHDVFQHAKQLSLPVEICEISKPEDLESCLNEMKKALEGIQSYDRIVINYTGGTKVMSAAIVHAALTTPVSGDLVFDYVGGEVRNEHGRVVKEAMTIRRSLKTATHVRMEQVLAQMRGHRYELANYLAQDLLAEGKSGFLRKAADALYHWDIFDYEKAVNVLRYIYRQAEALIDDALLGELAKTVKRLVADVATPITETIKAFRAWEQGQTSKVELEKLALLCADILENADRHCHRQEWTEAVLRGYRALEAAVQGALVLKDINPWRFDVNSFTPAQQKALREKLGGIPKELTLSSGIVVWQLVTRHNLDDEERKHLQDLQQTRNRSMLEHGYQVCDREDAERCLGYAKGLVGRVVELDWESLRAKVRLIC